MEECMKAASLASILIASGFFVASSAIAKDKLTEARMRDGNAVTVTFENCISINWGNIQCGEKYTLLYLPAKNIWQMSGFNIGQKQRIENGYDNVAPAGMHFSAWGFPVTYDESGVLRVNGLKAGYITW